MSITIMSAIFNTEFPDLSGADGEKVRASTAKLVLLAIADHANDLGESAYPGIELLTRKTGLSRRSVIYAIETMKYNGLLTVSDKPSRLGTNDYTLILTAYPCLCGGATGAPLLIGGATGARGSATGAWGGATGSLTSATGAPESSLTIIKPSINLNNKNSNFLKTICKLYESEIGVITPMIADALRDAEKDYPAGWVEDAVQAAARRNARNWSYVEAILKRWKRDGKNAPFQPAGNYKGNGGKQKTFLEKLEAA